MWKKHSKQSGLNAYNLFHLLLTLIDSHQVINCWDKMLIGLIHPWSIKNYFLPHQSYKHIDRLEWIFIQIKTFGNMIEAVTLRAWGKYYFLNLTLQICIQPTRIKMTLNKISFDKKDNCHSLNQIRICRRSL